MEAKKPIRLQNRTKYFSPDLCKTHVTFGSSASYQSRRIKIEGYETRLYWQFKYCQDHGGTTYFYTLTYNDAHVPKHYGINCFDYEDLRYFLTGGFRKQLLRRYGTTFKYFIGAELGDGKGSRGFHNNPHYHILFFLEDAKNERFPYKRISPYSFRRLVRLYWQGFDQHQDKMMNVFHRFEDARFGIAKEGENLGEVTDFRACIYCAKYVTKDVALKSKEVDIEHSSRLRLRSQLAHSAEFHNWFFRNKMFTDLDFNSPMDAKHTKWMYPTVSSFLWEYLPHDLFDTTAFISDDLTAPVFEFCRRYNYWKKYYDALDEYTELKVKEVVNEYRNRFCNKCRISHGVGDYALQHIEDEMNPLIKVPAKKGFKNRPIGMYYYRKMFTDVYIDKKGNPIRVLNDKGISYKASKLNDKLQKMSAQARSNFNVLVNDRALYDKMYKSDVNTSVTMYFDAFRKYVNRLQDGMFNLIFDRYAEYKLVYEDRFFPYPIRQHPNVVDFPTINVLDDYKRFLQPSFFSVSRSDLRLDCFLENGCPDYLPYFAHPYFLRYLGFFRVLDLCADYFFVQRDNMDEEEAKRIAETKRYHVARQLNL